MPELEKKKSSLKQEREAFVLEGYGGIKTFFKILLDEVKMGEEYYAFSLGNELKEENVKLFLTQHHKRREEKKIKIKLLLRPEDKKLLGLWKFKGMKSKFIKNPFPMGIYIFEDYVANVKFGDNPIIFVMKSKEVAKNYKEFFLDLWDKAKE